MQVCFKEEALFVSFLIFIVLKNIRLKLQEKNAYSPKHGVNLSVRALLAYLMEPKNVK